jgi:hypothetical protein
MPSTPFERRVNTCRGGCTAIVTLLSISIVLADVRCLAFWRPGAYEENARRTGWLGFATAALFLVYLFVDTVVGVVWRAEFRRSMSAVYLHHAVVAVGVVAFLSPSPPRGFFPYVWGEALTAVRLLPPAPRHAARTAVFALRRVLWLYLLARDASFFPMTAARWGPAVATVPPLVAVLLLGLDCLWWREHSKSGGGGAHASREAGASRPEGDREHDGLLGSGRGSEPGTPPFSASSCTPHLDLPPPPPVDLEAPAASRRLPRVETVQDLGTP